jgi:hypothetical protein
MYIASVADKTRMMDTKTSSNKVSTLVTKQVDVSASQIMMDSMKFLPLHLFHKEVE